MVEKKYKKGFVEHNSKQDQIKSSLEDCNLWKTLQGSFKS